MDYFSPEYHDPKTNIAKTHILGQQLPFLQFLTKFLHTDASISKTKEEIEEIEKGEAKFQEEKKKRKRKEQEENKQKRTKERAKNMKN